jgi:hypothetical protein
MFNAHTHGSMWECLVQNGACVIRFAGRQLLLHKNNAKTLVP